MTPRTLVSLLVVVGLLATTGGTVQADRFAAVGQPDPSATTSLTGQDDGAERTVTATTNVTIQVPDASDISVRGETNATTPSGDAISVRTNDTVRRSVNETGTLTFILNVTEGAGHAVNQEFTVPVTSGNDLSVSQRRTVTQEGDRGSTVRYTVRVREGDTLYIQKVRITVEEGPVASTS